MKYLVPVILLLLASSCVTTHPPQGLLGAYRLDDGRIVSIRRSSEDTLRYRFYRTGGTGRLYRKGAQSWVSGDGFSQRDPVTLTVRFDMDEEGLARQVDWQEAGKPMVRANRVGTEQEIWFESNGTRLFGRIQLPEKEPPYPVVVLVHGSGDSPGTEWLFDSDFFVANGIAALTYDKRGTGRSGGSFTFDFYQLARDAAAAVDSLKAIPELSQCPAGLSGYSQGAWVAPLAASLNDSIEFVIVNYGMITSPAEEARLEMRQILVDAGVSGQQMEDADELVRAAVNLVADGLVGDWSEFETLKEKYKHASWKHYLDGTPVGQLLMYPKFLVRLIGKYQLPKGLQWHYDSTELMESMDTPMTWLLGAEDTSAPGGPTIEILNRMIQAGKPYQLRIFPGADHSMLLFEQVDGERVYTGYAPGYFEDEVEAVLQLSR